MKAFQLLIAAASSGAGKTTFTLGLLRALRNRGIGVQPFKTGPDYIDTKFHQLASGEESVNLDPYMMSEQHIKYLYAKYAGSAQAAITEGAMGLFDGYERMQGSSAQVAEILGLPVILLVNAERTAYSVAPLIYGFKHFSPKIRIAGVIFNRVSSASQFRYLQDARSDVDIPCLGYLPRLKGIEIPSRHLGLSLDSLLGDLPEQIATVIEEYIDVDRLIELCSYSPIALPNTKPSSKRGSLRIAIARDEAFNFCYRENIARLEQMGQLCFFSPIRDSLLPAADFVYLPGGYPEYYLAELSANKAMREQIRAYVEGDGRLLAECGGMMYLCKNISDAEGKAFLMAGVLEATATMQQMRLHLGYRSFAWQGEEWRGHEFHYSKLLDAAHPSILQQYNARGEKVDTLLMRHRNCIAGYTHLYWGERELMQLFEQA